jgi:predicted nucleic acid-binding protein
LRPGDSEIEPVTTAFLDSDVIVEFLRGRDPSTHLFADDVRSRLQLATSPIVFQELFALDEIRRKPELLDQLQRELTVLPVDFASSARLLERASALRNRIAHSNDLLIFGSAATANCDYFVTYDRHIAAIPSSGKPKIVTPEQLLQELGVA